MGALTCRGPSPEIALLSRFERIDKAAERQSLNDLDNPFLACPYWLFWMNASASEGVLRLWWWNRETGVLEAVQILRPHAAKNHHIIDVGGLFWAAKRLDLNLHAL